MQKIKLILLLAATFMISQSTTCTPKCEGKHLTFLIQNNSAQTVAYRHFSTDSVYKTNGSPAPNMILLPNESTELAMAHKCLEDVAKDMVAPDYFFFFDYDTVKAIGWQAISGTNRGLLKRVTIDSAYIYDSSFTITYP
ncbi:MAG: hypothetical protein JST49_05315 [Bacteroidetes bacterium]|nr:hypothetical protein [Bacteroidota bacterium]